MAIPSGFEHRLSMARVPMPDFFGGSMKDVSLDGPGGSDPTPVVPPIRTPADDQEPGEGGDRKGSMVTLQISARSATGKPIGPVILMQGSLQKRTTGAISARWVSRKVVVEGEPTHMLCYYEEEGKDTKMTAAAKEALGKGGGNSRPKAVLRLSECTCYLKANSDVVFVVEGMGKRGAAPRTYEFKATSASEASEWVACISAAAEHAKTEWQDQQDAMSRRLSVGLDAPPPPPSAPSPRGSMLARTSSALGNVARRFSSSRALRVPAPEDGGSSGWEDVSPANPRGAPNFVGLQDVSGPEGGVYGSVDELSLHAMPPVSPQTQPTSSGKHKVSFAAQPP